jgi:hypothetical protein
MDYLSAWQRGFKEGKEFSLEQLNEHCKTNFANLVEVIMYIKDAEFNKKPKVENVKT